MKKVLAQMSAATGGYVEGLGHEIDWRLVDYEFNAFALGTPSVTEVPIMGRRTYQITASYR